MIKLFATDIDHTLYSSKLKAIPQENIDAIKALMSEGVTICFASSRSYEGMVSTLEMFDLAKHNGYAVALNGSIVKSCKDGKLLSKEVFSPSEIEDMYNLSKKINTGFCAIVANTAVTTSYCDICSYDFEHVGMDLLITNNIIENIKGDSSQLSFFDDNKNMYELVKEIPQEVRDKYNFNVPQSSVVDISLKKVSKLYGLSKVLQDMNITMDEVAAIGDNNNDIPMLQAARLSACVGDGSADAKKAGKYVVSNCADGGVSEFIHNYVMKEI